MGVGMDADARTRTRTRTVRTTRRAFVAVSVMVAFATTACVGGRASVDTDDASSLSSSSSESSSESSFVRALDVETLRDDVIARSRDPWVISFSGSRERCGMCGTMDDAFARAANIAARRLGATVKFGRVDATAENVDVEALGRTVGLTTIPAVKGYPTHATLNPYDARRSVKMPKTFETTGPDGGARAPRVEDLVAFAEETLPTHLVERARVREDERVRDAESIRIGAEEGVPTAVVVTNKKTTSASLKSIAHALEGRFRFLEVTYDEGEDAPRLPGLAADVGTPRVVVYPADASAAPIPFESDSTKRETVLAFLTEHAGPEVELKMETIDTSKKKTATSGDGSSSSSSESDRAFESTSLLKPARASEYDDIVSSNHKRMKMVAFTKSGEACEKIVDALPTSLEDLTGVVDLHEIIVRDDDASASALATKLELFRGEAAKRCAELVFLPSVDDEDDSRDAVTFEPTSEDVEGYSAKNVRRFILDQVPDLTISVTTETIDSSLFGIAATAPKVLLFAAADDAASRDVLHVMSATHREFVFGVTSDDNEALMSQFQVTKRPTLVVVYREQAATGDEPEGSMRMAIQKFPPEVALEQPMVNAWLTQLRTHILGVDTDAVVPTPKTVDASSALDDECAAKGGLCVVAFVKGDAVAEKKTVHAVAKSLYGKPFHFAIVDPTTQRSFAETFDVRNPVDYPTVTVMATRAMRFATHKGAFDAEDVKTFCEGVLSGKVKTWRFQEMPKLVEGGEKVEEVVEEDIVEEEFDLSDIMGEEVEGDAALSREELAARAEEELTKQQAEEAARQAEEAKKKATKAKKKRRRKKKKAKTEL